MKNRNFSYRSPEKKALGLRHTEVEVRNEMRAEGLFMEYDKVRLSKQGEEFLKSSNCSPLVGDILRSIETFSAEVLSVEDTFVRVKLSKYSLIEEKNSQKAFSVHKDHLMAV